MDSRPVPVTPWSILGRLGGRGPLLGALGLLLYAVVLAHDMGACAGGPDSSGYLNNARLLGEGRFRAPLRALPDPPPATLPPYTYVPLCFSASGDARTMAPTYPMGLPLLILGAARIVGWHWAPAIVMGLHSLVGLWLVLGLARVAGLEWEWQRLGVLLVAVSPLYLFLSLQTMSDVPAMVWTGAAITSAWTSRERSGHAIFAGFALGVAVLIRPTDGLALAPVAVALGVSVRRWARLVVGGLPALGFLGLVNEQAYGRAITTGYGDMSALFRLGNVPGTVLHYSIWLPLLLTPLILLAVGLPWTRAVPRRFKIVLASWAIVFPAFYSLYFPSHETWWYLRYVLPAFPPLVVAALLTARDLVVQARRSLRFGWSMVTPALVIVCGLVWTSHLHANRGGRYEIVYADLAAWLRAHLPPNAVVVAMQASGSLYYYDPFVVVRWDELRRDDFQRLAAACDGARRPIYAALFLFETEGNYATRFKRSLGVRWTKVATVQQASVWRYEPSP